MFELRNTLAIILTFILLVGGGCATREGHLHPVDSFPSSGSKPSVAMNVQVDDPLIIASQTAWKKLLKRRFERTGLFSGISTFEGIRPENADIILRVKIKDSRIGGLDPTLAGALLGSSLGLIPVKLHAKKTIQATMLHQPDGSQTELRVDENIQYWLHLFALPQLESSQRTIRSVENDLADRLAVKVRENLDGDTTAT